MHFVQNAFTGLALADLDCRIFKGSKRHYNASLKIDSGLYKCINTTCTQFTSKTFLSFLYYYILIPLKCLLVEVEVAGSVIEQQGRLKKQILRLLQQYFYFCGISTLRIQIHPSRKTKNFIRGFKRIFGN